MFEINQIPDDDLRRQLRNFGEDVGPISNSTRPYWEKRLSQLLQPSNVKKKTSKARSTKKVQFAVPSYAVRKRVNQIQKSVQIQLRDKNLIDNLKEFGVIVPRGPLNDAVRMQYQKKLNSLMSLAENGDLEYVPTNNLTDKNLIINLKEFGIKVSEYPLTDSSRNQCQEKLDSLMSEASYENRNSENETVTSQCNSPNYLKDLELINDLNQCGIKVPFKPLNDNERHRYQKVLEELMDDTSSIGLNSNDNEYTPPSLRGRSQSSRIMHLHVNQLTDNELRENLIAYGVHVHYGMLNEATRDQYKNLLHKLKTGVLPGKGFHERLEDSNDTYYYDNDCRTNQIVSKPRKQYWRYIISLIKFLFKGVALCGIIFIILVIFLVGMEFITET